MSLPDYYVKVEKDKIEIAALNLKHWVEEAYKTVNSVYETAKEDKVQVKYFGLFYKWITYMEYFTRNPDLMPWIDEESLFSHYGISSRVQYRSVFKRQLREFESLLRVGEEFYLSKDLINTVDEFQSIPLVWNRDEE